MTNILNKILFFGTEEFSLVALRGLIDAGYEIAAVITKPDSQKGRGQKLVPPSVKQLAVEHNIPVWQPTKLADIADDIVALQPVAGVLVSYGKIIPGAVIDLFTPGIVNLHPSLLPRYRGPSPIESAILNGDDETGVSIMQLSAAMDAGPVYQQKVVQLSGAETQAELYETLGKDGTRLLLDVLPAIINGSLSPTPQDERQVTYCSLIKKTDGIIDWTEPAATIERKIRAYKAWPQSRTTVGQVELIISRATVSASEHGPAGSIKHDGRQLVIYCGSGALHVESVKPLGKKEMPIQAFLAGYGSQLL